MKITRLAFLFCVALCLTGCAIGVTRTGYTLPAGKSSKDLPLRPIAIQRNVQFNTNDVVVLGSIHAYDTGFSINCDEAAVLEMFCREAAMVGADIVDITEDKQPNPWTSTCYRAKAEFLRLNDREKAKDLVSDAWYARDLIVERSVATGQRNREVLLGAVGGGLLGAIIVTGVTAPHPEHYTNSIPEKGMKKP